MKVIMTRIRGKIVLLDDEREPVLLIFLVIHGMTGKFTDSFQFFYDLVQHSFSLCAVTARPTFGSTTHGTNFALTTLSNWGHFLNKQERRMQHPIQYSIELV